MDMINLFCVLIRLVSLLDDRSWEALADLSAAEALIVIDEVADR